MNGGRVRTLLLAGFAVAALTGCELKDDGDNLVNGKTLFVQECSSCHTLARASAKGVVGPDLDEAWQQSEKDGLGRSTFEGMVHKQILHPNRNAQFDSETGKPLQLMPAELVNGEDAQDVAAYVASAAAAPGEDPGPLADAGGAKPEGTAKAEGGKLAIPVGVGLTYKFADAEAPRRRVDDRFGQRPVPGPQHRRRRRRRRREGRCRQGRRHVDGRGRPEGGRVRVLLLRARPPRGRHGGQAHDQVAARARSLASSRSCCCAACQKKNASAKTMIRMSSATIIAPAVCWSASASIPRRSPLPYTPV